MDTAHHRVLVTMSWDDGHPNDLRVAEMMATYGFRGTFYVPIRNREGLPVMSLQSLRQVASLHEIGSHTYSHCYLNTVSAREAEREILSGKAALEDLLGQSIPGFAYPGGKHRRDHVSMVREAGFAYARSIMSCRTDLSFDCFTMPTTLQIYPHKRLVYLLNFVSQGHWRHRGALILRLMRGRDLLVRLLDCLQAARIRHHSALHFWGHSWELDRTDGWRALEEFFQYAADQPEILMLQNRDVAAAAAE